MFCGLSRTAQGFAGLETLAAQEISVNCILQGSGDDDFPLGGVYSPRSLFCLNFWEKWTQIEIQPPILFC